MAKQNLIAQCTSCGNIFNIEEASLVNRSIYGINVSEKKCPECSSDFRMLNIPEAFDKLLFANTDARYFTYPDKKMSIY